MHLLEATDKESVTFQIAGSPHNQYNMISSTQGNLCYALTLTEQSDNTQRSPKDLKICIFVFSWKSEIRINSQSLEDTQVGYISQKYTLDKYTLEKYTLENF